MSRWNQEWRRHKNSLRSCWMIQPICQAAAVRSSTSQSASSNWRVELREAGALVMNRRNTLNQPPRGDKVSDVQGFVKGDCSSTLSRASSPRAKRFASSQKYWRHYALSGRHSRNRSTIRLTERSLRSTHL